MTDFRGSEIKVGDRCAYVWKTCNGAEMCVGVVYEIRKVVGRQLAFFDNGPGRGVTGRMVYRLDNQQDMDDIHESESHQAIDFGGF